MILKIFLRQVACASVVMLLHFSSEAADTLRVLFIGNSYTYYNNMPQMVAGFASASGDHLISSLSAPGGYTLQQHAANTTTTSLINQGNWNFVVLQEQSQYPSFPDAQVQADVFPYAKQLDQMIKAADSCAKTVFYMTWGRKNGDQSNCAFFPPLCTYQGMDSMLQLRYTMMADSNNAVLNPVAKVWRKLRTNHPSIELYENDESHPSLKGSYAIAASFYTIFFKKNPLNNSFTGGLNINEAATIRQVVKEVVYDSLNYWYSFYPSVKAGFNFTISGNTVSFQNSSLYSNDFQWFFGDGSTAATPGTVHTYNASGTYAVTLVAKKCDDVDTLVQQVNIGTAGFSNFNKATAIKIFPNPAGKVLNVSAAAPISDIQIFDPAGRLIKQWKGTLSHETSLSLEGLVPGLYFISLRMEEQFVRYSFLIE